MDRLIGSNCIANDDVKSTIDYSVEAPTNVSIKTTNPTRSANEDLHYIFPARVITNAYTSVAPP